MVNVCCYGLTNKSGTIMILQLSMVSIRDVLFPDEGRVDEPRVELFATVTTGVNVGR